MSDMTYYLQDLSLPDVTLHPKLWEHTEDLYLRVLYAIVRREQPMLLVELGSHPGYSAQSMAEALARNLADHPTKRCPLLYMVDDGRNGPVAIPEHLRGFVQGVSARTEDEARARELMAPYQHHGTGTRPVDLLFVDADHQFEGVSADYNCWSRYVRAGGLILFHDIRELQGSRDHWEALSARYPGQTAMREGCHLGAFRVPEPEGEPVYISPRREAPSTGMGPVDS